MPRAIAARRYVLLHDGRWANCASNRRVMPLHLPREAADDVFLASLFLTFAAILRTDGAARAHERKRLTFIYEVFRLVHPDTDLYSERQLERMIAVDAEDINRRALRLATLVRADLTRVNLDTREDGGVGDD